MSKRTNKVVFKNYTPNQMLLLPPSLDEKIAEHHPVRVVNQVIEQINIEPLVKKYEGGGTSSYHPKMLLKVMVYAYLNNVYSSRKIEESLQQNIHFMWLSGMNEPDHNTINRFRGERLKEVLKPIFTQVVLLLSEAGLVNLKELYVDGTKIEANANRYTFVWGKSIENNKEKIKKQLEELWSYTQQVAAEEMQDSEPLVFEKIDAQQVKQTIARIDEALQGKEVSKKVKQKLRYAKK
jgi:transposase